MDDVQCFPFRQTGYFSDLICDYLDRDEKMAPYYGRFPEIDNFSKQIEEKKDSFSAESREVLVRSLKEQYRKLGKSLCDGRLVWENIEKLGEENTFTVTTGHQLSLFTGPLYFIYKIVSTIRLAEELRAKYPLFHFVPVYWMASEDHDFPEINHINLRNGRLNWEKVSSGPVGRLETYSLEKLIDQLEDILGPGKNSDEITGNFRRAYLGHSDLAEATRYLVHELFADKGLVVLDGDERELKKRAIPFFRSDLFEHIPSEKVQETSSKLSENYFEQVYAREINLFYIGEGLRERIERKKDKWVVLNTDIVFSREQLENELNEYPERFSPNVVLRPLYQEVVLPNLSYTGGGGELAYWFQLKAMFDHWEVPFPILILRNSVLWIAEKEQKKLERLGLKPADLFRGKEKLKSLLAAQAAPVDPELEPYQEKLREIFDQLEDVAHLTDKSMLGAVNAQRQKQLNGLENLRKKLIRAEKRRNGELMEQVDRICEKLFPEGGLQERHDNLVAYYKEYGKDFLNTLYRDLHPLDFCFVIITRSTE